MTEIDNDTDRHLDEVLELHGALAVAILALRMIAGRNYPGEHNPERLAATAIKVLGRDHAAAHWHLSTGIDREG
jgi:hypothetical protein